MTRYIKDKDGKFAGSVGDGRHNVPTAADYPVRPPVRDSGTKPEPSLTELAFDTFKDMPRNDKAALIARLEESVDSESFPAMWEEIVPQLPRVPKPQTMFATTGGPRDLADLRGIDLSGADLRFVKIEDVCLAQANLSGTRLENIKIERSDISDARLIGADLNNAHIRYSDISGSDMTLTKLDKTVFYNTRVRDVTFDNAAGIRTCFRDAHVSRSRFTAATLHYADFRNATCYETIFKAASLTGANMHEAKLGSAYITPDLLADTNGRPNWGE